MASAEELIQESSDETYNLSGSYDVKSEYLDEETPVFMSRRKKLVDDGEEFLQGEVNSRYKTFVIDRFVDGVDIVSKEIEIQYNNEGSGGNSRPCNVMVGSKHIKMGWIVPGGATVNPGKLDVIICAADEKYIYKTETITYSVMESMTFGEDINYEPSDYVQFIGMFNDKLEEVKQYTENAAYLNEYADNAKGFDDKLIDLKDDLYEYKVQDLTDNLAWEDSEWIRQNFIESMQNYATAKIRVSPGDKFIISGTIFNWQSLFVVRDSNDLDRSSGGELGLLLYPSQSEFKQNIPYATVENLEFVIPENGKYLYVNKCAITGSGGDADAFKLEKAGMVPKVTGVNETITDIVDKIDTIDDVLNGLKNSDATWQKRIIDEQVKNDFSWNDFDGLYATITFDDSNPDIDALENLAEELNIPFCYATVPSRLGNVTSLGTETVKDVLIRAVDNGGEVLSHWEVQLNSLSTDDDYYNVYIGCKRTLEENGFDVNGIITAGGGTDGTPQSFKTQDWNKCIKMARIYYQYADITANDFVDDLRYIEQFYNKRTFTDGGVDDMKSKIDAMTEIGHGWLNMASHGTNTPKTSTVDDFRQIFEYAIEKGYTFVTWKTMYDKFKSSKLEQRIKALENK